MARGAAPRWLANIAAARCHRRRSSLPRSSADCVTCATFEAARTTRPGGVERTPTLPRPVARTTPVVLDHGRITIAMPSVRSERLSGQAIVVILLALAFAAILAAR